MNRIRLAALVGLLLAAVASLWERSLLVALLLPAALVAAAFVAVPPAIGVISRQWKQKP